jgi:hypothetical protein
MLTLDGDTLQFSGQVRVRLHLSPTMQEMR